MAPVIKMDWLQFVASITRSLAWPGSIFGIVFLLQDPLKKTLENISKRFTKLHGWGINVELAREIEDVKSEVEVASGTDSVELSATIPESLIILFDKAPAVAVEQAWMKADAALTDYAQAIGIPNPSEDPKDLVQQIIEHTSLDEQVKRALIKAATLRPLQDRLIKLLNDNLPDENRREALSVTAAYLQTVALLIYGIQKLQEGQPSSPQVG